MSLEAEELAGAGEGLKPEDCPACGSTRMEPVEDGAWTCAVCGSTITALGINLAAVRDDQE